MVVVEGEREKLTRDRVELATLAALHEFHHRLDSVLRSVNTGLLRAYGMASPTTKLNSVFTDIRHLMG